MNQDTKSILVMCGTVLDLTLGALTGLAHGEEEKTSESLILLRLLPADEDDQDEPPGDRDARLAEIASAIDSVSRSNLDRALLLSLGWHESRWSSAICSGEKLGDGGRAFGCFQSWERDRSGGLKGQARRAIRHLRRSGNYCASRGFERISGAFSLYATGSTCDWPAAKARQQLTWSIHWRLGKLEKEKGNDS